MDRIPVLAVTAAALLALLAAALLSTREGGEPGAAVVAAPVAAATPSSADLRRTARATGIPARALEAYVAASRRLAREDPGCRLAWNTLAGIGASESSHGAFAGARLDGAGRATPLIVGVPLDGTRGNRAIRDTDDGALDGDRRWDRAVGPMQFIPTTWARWGASADGSGAADPHDIDDAALAAARYLCGTGGDLTSSQGWSRAVLTYNASTAYARKVASTATSYAEAG